MGDGEVAKRVELAQLSEMADMNIDDVYTLMDVQLNERPGPRELYKRWEKQNWSAYDLDFSKDRSDWENFPETIKVQLLLGFRGFFLGEAAVTDTLSPLVHAAPTDEDRQFLSTQLVDEARHTIFFERFFKEALGEAGLDAARKASDAIGYTANADRGYSKLFYKDLPEVTDAVRLDPVDYGKWVDAVVLYHMLVEGMLALSGQRRLLNVARMFDILPGFRAGFTMVTRDESRHVNYAVFALSAAVKLGLADRIVDRVHRHLDETCDVVTAPFRRIEVSEELARQFPIRESWEFSVMQLRKRMRVVGISAEAIEGFEDRWWKRVESNLDEYERLFDEAHPARRFQEDSAAEPVG
jgi:ribonucleoside-diphosphate reductase beta chain